MRRIFSIFIEPLEEHPHSKLVFFSACLIFLVIRIFIAFSAIDHMHNVDGAEYNIAKLAHQILNGTNPASIFNHLWAQKPMAIILSKIVRLGLTATVGMKIMAVFISFLGFAPLVYLLAWRFGPKHAAVLGLLMIFCDLTYLQWTLTLWSAYPEATSFFSVAFLVWAGAVTTKRPSLFFLSGLLTGLILSFTLGVSFLALTMVALVPMVALRYRWIRTWIFSAAGMTLGLAPLAVWMAAKGYRADYSPEESIQAVKLLHWISYPDFNRCTHLLDFFTEGNGLYDIPIQYPLVGIAFFWILLSAFFKAENRERWLIFLPFSLVLCVLMVSVFPFAGFLAPRHVLWFYPAGYLAMAVFLTEKMVPARYAVAAYVEKGVKTALIVFLVCRHLFLIFPLLQIKDLGITFRLRGHDYSLIEVGMAIGDEIDNMNCLLDANPRQLKNNAFLNGLRIIFPMEGQYRCCHMKPVSPQLETIRGPVFKTDSPKDFYIGLGCGLALKTTTSGEDLSRLPLLYNPSARDWAGEGYRMCAELPCLKQ